MKTKVTIFFLLISFTAGYTWGQNPLDSLKQVVKTIEDDTVKARLLEQLALNTLYQSRSEAFVYISQLRTLSTKMGYKKGLARAHSLYAEYYYLQNEYSKAEKSYLLSIYLFQEIEMPLNAAWQLNLLGALYSMKGNNVSALNYYIEALSELQKISKSDENLEEIKSAILNNLGVAYDEEGNKEKALEYYLKAKRISTRLKDTISIANTLINIGEIKREQKNSDEALINYKEALGLYTTFLDSSGISTAYNNIGLIHEQKEEYSKAIAFYRKSLNIEQKIDSKSALADTYNNMASAQTGLGRYSQALANLNAAKKLAIKYGLKLLLKDTYLNLSETYRKMGSPTSALEFHHKYSNLKDSLVSRKNNKLIVEMEARYESAEKEKEIALLQKDAQLHKIQFKQQKSFNLFTAIGGFFVLLMAIFLFVAYSQKKGMNSMLRLQKAEIETKNKELLALNDEKNYLISIVAHDLKSPLNQISGLVKLLKSNDSQLDPENIGYIGMIEKSIHRLDGMVTKILDVNAIDSKKLNLKLEESNLNQIIKTSIDDFAVEAKEKRINIVLHEVKENVIAMLDQNYISQIFSNLISNAIKYSPAGETVIIEISNRGDSAKVSIKDNGPGIHPEDVPNLFKKFQRLKAQPTANESSFGLGLSIVKKYAEAMNGKVWCNSVYGKGSDFVVTFPIHKS